MSRQRRKWRILSTALFALGVGAVVIGGAAGTGSPAPVAEAAVASQPMSTADVNDFTFDSFDAEYELGRNADGHSTLRTVERIVAVFPDFDQNRGFIRDIPREYDGYDTHIKVVSVTDENGKPRPYSVEPYGDDYLSVTMAVPEGSYVHGAQTYILEYTQRDVAKRFEDASADTDLDEFYWDVNGTDWQQPFGRVSARLTLSEELVDAFSGNASCYRGAYGSSAVCELRTEGRTIIADETDFGSGENLTIAVGFAPGTFTMPQPPFLERFPILIYAGIASFLASIGLTVFGAIRNRRGVRTGRAIIAQYEPPEGVSAALAAEMVSESKKAMTATLLDLAVRHHIRLLYDEPSGAYGAQALSDEALESDERSVYRRIFGAAIAGGIALTGSVVPGTTSWFDPKSTKLGDASAMLRKSARAAAVQRGYLRKARGWVLSVAPLLLILALALPVLHAILVGNQVLMTVLLAVGINALVWLILGMVALLATGRARTMSGALLHDHLMGLREYIRLAEADRIRMLQSASGAEVSEERIVQVYERLLPYAVLFGYEKEWQGELAKYYRESTPEWSGGSAGSNFRVVPLSGLHSVVASSPVTRTTSSGSSSGSSFSSHSGSSGGGFSGGGGGGGGGRGI